MRQCEGFRSSVTKQHKGYKYIQPGGPNAVPFDRISVFSEDVLPKWLHGFPNSIRQQVIVQLTRTFAIELLTS